MTEIGPWDFRSVWEEFMLCPETFTVPVMPFGVFADWAERQGYAVFRDVRGLAATVGAAEGMAAREVVLEFVIAQKGPL